MIVKIGANRPINRITAGVSGVEGHEWPGCTIHTFLLAHSNTKIVGLPIDRAGDRLMHIKMYIFIYVHPRPPVHPRVVSKRTRIDFGVCDFRSLSSASHGHNDRFCVGSIKAGTARRGAYTIC